MIDLLPHDFKLLQDRIKADIEAYSVKTLTQQHRDHLGASIIGHGCERHIWYAFRWVHHELFTGRMLRLFETGNREEQRFIELLRGIGWQVWSVDSDGNQFRITGAQGHYGGSTDSIVKSPYTEFSEPILCEFKSHNRGSFAKLIKDGVCISKPRHYAQMCAYGIRFGFRYGLYLAINKDDDDIYPEIVALDPRRADDLALRAEDIIFSQMPPPKISLQPEYYECKFCPFKGICHDNQPVEKNCRSCRHAYPVDNARWECRHWGGIIPKEFIPQGCGDWESIT